MNKTELAKKLASVCGLKLTEALSAVDGVTEIVSDELANGRSVVLTGFGTFRAVPQAAREGRNPATGKPMTIAAKTVARFKAGKALADRVAGE